MATQFNYTISTDTLNAKVAESKLSNEIQNSTITISIDAITTTGDSLIISFKTDLTTAEETTLDSVVNNHDGVPSIDDPQKFQLVDNNGNPIGSVSDGNSVNRIAFDFGESTIVGPQGDTGPQGPQGDTGPAGPISIFGSEYQRFESLSSSSTTSSSYIEKASFNTTNLPSGNYFVRVQYTWRQSNTGDDFRARVQLNNSTTLFTHQQEPKDSGSDQNMWFHWSDEVSMSGTTQIDVDFSEVSGSSAFIANVSIILWRIS